MTMDPYEIKELPSRQLSAQQMAKSLMRNIPSRGWDNYDGLDETLRVGIRIAESHQSDFGAAGMIEQYGSASIVSEMKSLRAALNVLADQGTEGLSQQDRHALAMGNLTIGGMIQQSLVIADFNKPRRETGGIAPEFLPPDSEGYWQERIRKLMARPAGEEREEYSKSKQFSHYLVDVQKVLSTICHDLGIQQIQQRNR